MKPLQNREKDKHARMVVAHRLRLFFKSVKASAQKETDALIKRINTCSIETDLCHCICNKVIERVAFSRWVGVEAMMPGEKHRIIV